MNRDLKQILFKGECFDNNDPEGLGRIRAYDKSEHKTEKKNASLIKGNTTIKPWSDDDPYVYKPLLPWFINIIPKGQTIDGEQILTRGEAVHLLYSNLDRKDTTMDRYYVGGIYSTPLSVNREPYDSAISFTEEGINNNKRVNPKITDDSGNTIDEVKGIYPNTDDLHIGGRGSSDIIIKDGDIVLRSGIMNIPETKKLPKKNNQRGFLQLSKFDFNTVKEGTDSISVLERKDKQIKKLIEYSVNNIENSFDRFQGSLYVYHLDKPNYTTYNITGINDVISEEDRQPQLQVSFKCLPKEKISILINDLIKDIKNNFTVNNVINNKEKYFIDDDDCASEIFFEGDSVFEEGSTPLFFRPSPNFFSKTIRGGVVVDNNLGTTQLQDILTGNAFIEDLLLKIKVEESDDNGKGYGLIYDKKSNTVPVKAVKEERKRIKFEEYDKTVGLLGANTVYLLSHDSKKEDKPPIDISNSLDGINENLVMNEIHDKTSSMVRGEELMEFLNLIIEFLSTHTHGFPGEKPNPKGVDSPITVGKILEEYSKFKDKVLNKNIRIN